MAKSMTDGVIVLLETSYWISSLAGAQSIPELGATWSVTSASA
jgi:hypothetical protein